MAWSKNPLVYPSIYRTLLEAAREQRVRVKFKVGTGRQHKYKFQFYAYCEAWRAKAAQSRKLQQFALAAEEEANAAMLQRYLPVVEEDGISFVNKEVIVMEDGLEVEISEETVADENLESIKLVAEASWKKEQQLAEKKKGKENSPRPLHFSIPGEKILTTEEILMKRFGVKDVLELRREAGEGREDDWEVGSSPEGNSAGLIQDNPPELSPSPLSLSREGEELSMCEEHLKFFDRKLGGCPKCAG